MYIKLLEKNKNMTNPKSVNKEINMIIEEMNEIDNKKI
jgi:hypothetical protein